MILEHGIVGLRELLMGGYPFVSANLQVEDRQVQQHLRPAYIIEIAGGRIGVTGLTTLSTFDLIPCRILQGITLTEPEPALVRVVATLEPQVDTIIVLLHLGFYENGTGDPGLARLVADSKVSVILGAHTHDALDPARIVAGITICNAGASGSSRLPGILTRKVFSSDHTKVDASLLSVTPVLARCTIAPK